MGQRGPPLFERGKLHLFRRSDDDDGPPFFGEPSVRGVGTVANGNRKNGDRLVHFRTLHSQTSGRENKPVISYDAPVFLGRGGTRSEPGLVRETMRPFPRGFPVHTARTLVELWLVRTPMREEPTRFASERSETDVSSRRVFRVNKVPVREKSGSGTNLRMIVIVRLPVNETKRGYQVGEIHPPVPRGGHASVVPSYPQDSVRKVVDLHHHFHVGGVLVTRREENGYGIHAPCFEAFRVEVPIKHFWEIGRASWFGSHDRKGKHPFFFFTFR